MAPTHIVTIPAGDRHLDEFDSEQGAPVVPSMTVVEPEPPQNLPAVPVPFSRVDAAHTRCDSFSYVAVRIARGAWQRSRGGVHRSTRWVREEFAAAARRAAPARASVRHGAADLLGYVLALCAWGALRCDSLSYVGLRIARRASRSSRRAARRSAAGMRDALTATRRTGVSVARWLGRRRARPADGTLDHLEWEGAVVAAALATVAIGYGGLIVVSWRNHSAPVPLTTTVASPIEPVTVEPIVAPILAEAPSPVTVGVASHDRPDDVRPRARLVNASMLSTIWRRGDTRSLQQAFASLRRDTLAFHRCTMAMTGSDRAVAHCDSAAPRATWVINFQRAFGRWTIQRVDRR